MSTRARCKLFKFLSSRAPRARPGGNPTRPSVGPAATTSASRPPRGVQRAVPMDLLDAPLAHTEFLVVDTETNGKAGDACELTEVGAVLVGGGELHDRWESLVGVRAPPSRGVQRFTGITQSMVDDAPAAEPVLPDLAEKIGRASCRE